MFEINILAVVISAVAAQVLGFLWYGPFLGKVWSQEMGWPAMTPEIMKEKQKEAVPGYIANIVFALITSYVFAHVLAAFESTSIVSSLTGVFWMWLGFVLPVHAGKKFWMGKSWKLVWIDSLYSLVSLVVTGIILQVW